jgi:hypothetical protein
MFAIEYFVGSARGTWIRGRRKYHSLADAENVMRADWQTEAREYTGVFHRRVVGANGRPV